MSSTSAQTTILMPLICGVMATATPSQDTTMNTTTAFHLERPEGKIAWSSYGTEGPLVIAMPGMGDLRIHLSGFAEALADHGYRVAVLDLRGHGKSDAGFADMSREAMAKDALALADSLSPSDPVILVGHSYTGASVIWAAAERPERVRAAILISPFTRNVPISMFQAMALKLGLLRPWGPALWARYYTSLFPVHKPADLEFRRKAIKANLAEPGRIEALRAMGRTDITECEHRLDSVRVPTLVLFGTKDSDFPDPALEAQNIAERTGGVTILIPDAGHYPHEEDPAGTAGQIATFLQSTTTAFVSIGEERP